MEMYKRCQKMAWQKLGDHTLLLDNNNCKMAHHLDEVGSFIWKKLESDIRQEDLLKYVLSEFDVPEEKASQDLGLFLKQLLDLNLIEKYNV